MKKDAYSKFKNFWIFNFLVEEDIGFQKAKKHLV